MLENVFHNPTKWGFTVYQPKQKGCYYKLWAMVMLFWYVLQETIWWEWFFDRQKGALLSLNAACKYILYTCSNCVIVTKLLRDTFLLLQYFLLFIFFSRAHTIVAITFTQKQMNETGQSMTRTSTVNLVDLAGRYVHKSRSIQ